MSGHPPEPGGDRPGQGSPTVPAAHDDELSLADLVRALGRRWRWIAGCALVAVIAASAFAFGRTPQYPWTATVRVGSLPMPADTEGDANAPQRKAIPIDAISNVVAELERYYVPAAARATGHSVSAEASQIGNSDLVELTVTAPMARKDAVLAVVQRAIERLVADHRHALEGRLQQLRARRGGGGPAASAAMLEALRKAIELLAPPHKGEGAIEAQARAENLLQSNDPLLRPTRIVALPHRAGGPTGIAAEVVLALALVLGLGAGVVLALLVDAVRREPPRRLSAGRARVHA